jgi:hypothetical protein
VIGGVTQMTVSRAPARERPFDMARPQDDDVVSRELRVMARGRDEKTPLRVLAVVSLLVGGLAAVVTLVVLLIYYVG